MRLPAFDYLEPRSVGEACRLLREAGTEANVIAGGTDLVTALKQRLKTPKLVVGLNRIASLRKTSYSNKEGLKIGAMATLRDVASHETVRERYPMLARAALSVGSVQLQAMGTVGGNVCQDNCCIYYSRSPMMRQAIGPCIKLGGNVCHAVKNSKQCWATYCGDVAPVLLALKATVILADEDGEKIVPFKDIFSGKGERPHSLGSGQILTHLQLPPPRTLPSGGTYLKMRVRKAIDYPLLGVAVHLSLDGGVWKDAAIGLTGVDMSPLLIQSPLGEGNNDFSRLTEDLAEAAFKSARPIANTYGYSPGYRREMVRVYVRQAMNEAQRIALATGGAS